MDLGERAEIFQARIELLDISHLYLYPQLSGCILFATPDTCAIFLHNDLLVIA